MALRNWLQDRKEKNILEDTVNFSQKVLETVHEFERAFNFLTQEKNKELAYTVFERVLNLEHEADMMRRSILIDITKSNLDSQMRQDLMVLIKRIDQIANEADRASRIVLGLHKNHIYELGDIALNFLGEVVHKSVEATKLLFGLIKKMVEMDDKEVFRITAQIANLEHECDILQTKIYIEINQQKESNINPFVAVQLGKFIDKIENITNKVEDVCDYIELIKTLESTQR